MGMGAEKGNGRGMAARVGCMFLGQCVSGSQSQAAKISRVKHWREEREGVLDCLRHPCVRSAQLFEQPCACRVTASC